MNKNLSLILSFLLLSSTSMAQVSMEKVVPLPNKKTKPSKIRLDNNNQVWVFDLKKNLLQQISDTGMVGQTINSQNKSLFKTISDFQFMKDGRLILADASRNQVVIIRSTSKDNPWSTIETDLTISVPKPMALDISRDDIVAVGSDKIGGVRLFSIDGVHLYDLRPPEENEIKSINGVSFSPDGTVWVLDGSEGLAHRFSAKRKWLGKTAKLKGGRSIDVDEYGFAYVLLKKGRWSEINPAGKITETFGTKGKEPGKMRGPTTLALQSGSSLWVADTGNKRLQQFNLPLDDKHVPMDFQPTARVQIRKGKDFNLSLKHGLYTQDNNMLFLHNKKNRFEWMNTQGESINSFTNKGKKEAGLSKPSMMVESHDGTVWVLDAGEHKIKQISKEGEVLKMRGEKGRREGSIKNPVGFAIADDDTLFIADKNGKRFQAMSNENLFLFALKAEGDTAGKFEIITEFTKAKNKIGIIDNKKKSFLIYDLKGKVVKEIANKKGKAPIWGELASITSDSDGRFYILDSDLQRVRIFSNTGRFISDFKARGIKLAAGPDHKLLVMQNKSAQEYRIHPVSYELKDFKVEAVDGNVHLTWSPDPSASAYRVYRTTDATQYSLLKEIESMNLIDKETIPGLEYLYAVKGVNSLGYEGNWTFAKPIEGPRKKNVSLISFGNIDFDPIFSAAYKFYSDEPVGVVEIQNNDSKPFVDVKISLGLKNYTDYATEKVVPLLDAGQKLSVPMTITLNDKVLEITEDTPVQADVTVSYYENNEEKKLSNNAPMKIYSRNAISWKNKERIASFITPKDPPIVEFTRMGIKSFLKQLKSSTVGKPLAKAALYYEAMNALDITYVQDPLTPYSSVSNDPEILDFVQFPRETLRRKTGDCDDTSALLSALLESIGVETALVDTPGHILVMVNLEETDPQVIGFPEEQFIDHKGSLWVPIETTKLGHSFIDAWQAGLEAINGTQDQSKVEFISFSVAREKFAPVTLVEIGKDQPAFPVEKLKKNYIKVMKELENDSYERKLEMVKKEIRKYPEDNMLRIQLGMVHIEGRQTEKGTAIFKELLQDESVEVQAAAHNNLGNVAYLNNNFKLASKSYQDAAILSPDDGGIVINRARTAWKMKNKSEAKKFLMEARDIMPDWREFAKDLPAEIKPK